MRCGKSLDSTRGLHWCGNLYTTPRAARTSRFHVSVSVRSTCLTAFSRIAHHIKHLHDLIIQFPRINPSATEPSELDIPRLFRQIRSRYKALCATLGVKPTLRAAASSPAREEVEDPGNTPPVPTTGDENKKVWNIDNTRASGPQDLSF